MHRDAGRAVTLVVKVVGATPVPSTMKLRAINYESSDETEAENEKENRINRGGS